MAEALAFTAPEITCQEFPAWDCLPYDRVSPNSAIVARRIDTLIQLLDKPVAPGSGRAVLTTISALTQKAPPKAAFKGTTLTLAQGERIDPRELTAFLVRTGYGRVQTVMEPGEFAVRGDIVDVFPSGAGEPLRLGFFGDNLDGVRAFDPSSQRSLGEQSKAAFKPVSEVPLDQDAVCRFRLGYRKLFGAVGGDDPLYEAVSAGRRHMGIEHWLPLFHERLETLLDYLPGAPVFFDHQAKEAGQARLDLVAEYFSARVAAKEDALSGPPYNPVPPELLFLDEDSLERALADRPVAYLSPFAYPEEMAGAIDLGGRPGRDFADVRVRSDVNVFDALGEHMAEERKSGRRLFVAAASQGSRERLLTVLREHGLEAAVAADTWEDAQRLPDGALPVVVLELERGFVTDEWAVVSEQDLLGDRLVRRLPKVKPENFIAEASTLAEGDLVVHVDHGVGRFDGLEAIEAAGAPHDCLRLVYEAGDRLYLPVENIEVISRYGSEMTGARLDRLGGAAWQARKGNLKKRIRKMAEELIKVAASRKLRSAPGLTPPEGLFEEFCARFPYTETEDQRQAIDSTIQDLASGKPTDRLVCGDVGFGKTEVALRAAFVAVLSGKQVAVATPTTLLCRQHFQTFVKRFKDLPVNIGQMSRLVTGKQATKVKADLADGQVDIVIGTHALLAKSVRFHDLGLLVVDEEQHFGVAHKERLKKLRSNVHVVTLTATPIPRTLQLALAGVREMSLIASPPVDRLAVRTFVLPFDPVVIREAILRERFRGGQTFYVCPRIDDLEGEEARLKKLVPEAKVVTVHGRMAVRDLEERVSAFYDGKYDILLSTNIIESGLDLPSANTIIIHRADMFGLAQLYQLRGRVGRSKVRAYAYLALPCGKTLTSSAEKRLEVMRTLDSLGAGFSLASYDLDIRGAGNLLGEEQSGHIREVGIELYQQMLEEAVAEARGVEGDADSGQDWSPRISLGMAVLIPESYVADLNVRLSLYRRLARLTSPEEIDGFAAELIDRFGPLPPEVENLLQVVAIKRLCHIAGVEKVEAGPKGAVVSFRNDTFSNPAGLVQFIAAQVGTAKLRPDHKLVYKRSWEGSPSRMSGVKRLITDLSEVATAH